MGRRSAAEASRATTCLQRNAQRNAQTDGPAARVYPKAYPFAWLPKYFPSGYRGRRPDGLLFHCCVQTIRNEGGARDKRQRFVSTRGSLRESLYDRESRSRVAQGRIRITRRRASYGEIGRSARADW